MAFILHVIVTKKSNTHAQATFSSCIIILMYIAQLETITNACMDASNVSHHHGTVEHTCHCGQPFVIVEIRGRKKLEPSEHSSPMLLSAGVCKFELLYRLLSLQSRLLWYQYQCPAFIIMGDSIKTTTVPLCFFHQNNGFYCWKDLSVKC